MKKTTGWLLVVLGIIWGFFVVSHSPPSGPDGLGISRMLGALVIPTFLLLAGLYFAGVIKNAK